MRILPKPNRKTVCAQADESILGFYESVFDSVFVSLNPFIKINEDSKLKYEDWFVDEYPNKKTEIQNTSIVKWSEILNLCKLSSLSEIDVALRTTILGLKTEFKNENLAIKLTKATKGLNILHPSEGCLQEHDENRVLNAIKKLGYDWICLGGEYGESMQLEWIDDILNFEKETNVTNLYTYDNEVLITMHWDSFQTYVCSSREKVEFIVKSAKLEGFYCEPETEIYWSLKK